MIVTCLGYGQIYPTVFMGSNLRTDFQSLGRIIAKLKSSYSLVSRRFSGATAKFLNLVLDSLYLGVALLKILGVASILKFYSLLGSTYCVVRALGVIFN